MRSGSLALVLVVAIATMGAQSTAPLTREQALENIRKGDVQARRMGALALGELGTMADVPVMLQALRDDDEGVRAAAESSVWQVWSRSGDPAIDALFSVGVEPMTRGDANGAIATFTEIIKRKPDFAEGWNKRATIYYLVGEYEKSLKDCDEVMKRNPSHFGALAGYGQIYLQLDQPERALDYFRQALRVNPNLRGVAQIIPQLERALMERRKGTI